MGEQALISCMESIPQCLTARGAYADWLEEHDREEEARFLRLVEMSGKEFLSSIKAQKDDEDYDESGWVICKVLRGGKAYGLVAHYGHCSCYDTWADLCGGGIGDYYPLDQTMHPSFHWVGTWETMLDMARKGISPLTGGPFEDSAESYTYRHLKETYAQLLEI